MRPLREPCPTCGAESPVPTRANRTDSRPAMLVYQCPDSTHEGWVRPMTDEDREVLAKIAEEIRRRGLR